MRRQARSLGGGARLVRSASALQAWLWLLIFIFQNEPTICKSIQPGYLDFDNLPETNFTCEGKVIGGYYADLEASCQMFHVCTVGQQDEPMDIKFLCLNGTVFDQETRVCERVDEVDCTKSEKFYSLNLELYGSTIAPPAKSNETKSEPPMPTAEATDDYDDPEDLPVKTDQHRTEKHSEYPDTTEDTDAGTKNYNNQNTHPGYPKVQPTNPASTRYSEHIEPVEENQEEEEIDSEVPEYDEEYSHSSPSTTTTYFNSPITTTTKAPATTTVVLPQPTSSQPTSTHISESSSGYKPISTQQSSSQTSANPTLDPALLSPQEFIYRHRGPGAEAISFQRQGFRPADGVYITHAPTPQPPQMSQYEHYQYESSRTAPRPVSPQQNSFVKRPAPAPFRATTIDPRDQLLRPSPSSQSSERHETSIKARPYLPPPPSPSLRPYESYYYDRKRSDDHTTGSESTLAARSVGPPVNAERPPSKINAERPPSKIKSPPRVIVTASASVSDSNGKRLNYTVGNVVSAVKPIVPINYDDYKESDLIFDPFFLDVPKLSKNRKNRGSNHIHPALVRMFADIATTASSNLPQASVSKKDIVINNKITTTTAAWSPYDYVDDNYEAQALVPPVHSLAVLNMPFDRNKIRKETSSHSMYSNKRTNSAYRKKPSSLEESKAARQVAQLSSSQILASSALVAQSSSKSNCTAALSADCKLIV